MNKGFLDIGIPNYIDLLINKEELLQISDDEVKTNDYFNYLEKEFKNQKFYTQGIAFFNFGYDYVKSIIFNTSIIDSKSRLLVDFKPYIIELQLKLNLQPIDQNFNNYKTIFSKAIERLKLLNEISTYNELKDNFPSILVDYLEGRNLYRKIEAAEDSEERKKLEFEYYRLYKFKNNISCFVKDQSKKYYNEIINFNKYIDLCSRFEFDINDSGIDVNKLKLLIAYKYYEYGIQNDSKEVWQEILYFMLPLRTDNDLNYVSINLNGNKIDKNFIDGFCKYIIEKYDLIPFSANRQFFLGMSFDEVAEFKKKQLEIQKIKYKKKRSEQEYSEPKKQCSLPIKEVRVEVPNEIESVKPVKKYAVSREGSKKFKYVKSKEELNNLYNRKINLLETDCYMAKFVTDMGYDGYIFYIYPNGLILRERYFFDYANGVIANGEAMYIFNQEDFLSVYDKASSDLTNLPDDVAVKINHSKKFESRAKYYIEQPATEESISKTEKFIENLEKEKKLILEKKNIL